MAIVRRNGDSVVVTATSYRLTIVDGFPLARLEDADGGRWAEFALLSGIDTTAGLDETVRLEPARFGPVELGSGAATWRMRIEAVSSAWPRKHLVLEGDDDELRLRWEVEADGDAASGRRLTTVHLLGGYFSDVDRRPTGFVCSASAFDRVFSPEPSDPARWTAPSREPASLDVLGGFWPGRGHWFFTPPPLCLAFGRGEKPGWLSIGLVARPEDEHFTTLDYLPGERSFSLALEYEGHTAIGAKYATPTIEFRVGLPDAYAALAAHGDAVRRAVRGAATARPHRPAWWLEPIFCGWGAQNHLAKTLGGRAPDYATERWYEEFLSTLAARDLRPGTVVLDDRWQAAYGTNEPDTTRWPDLRTWIARRHEAGQRVVLWFKAWDPEGLPADVCVRNAAGRPVAADPSNPKYEELLRSRLWQLLGPDGYDADGLKVDFTAHTPSGPGLERHGREWGISLLHRLLAILHDGAHRAKPEALLITHSPDPGFAAVSDMVRVNDMMRLDEPDPTEPVVDQAIHRARVVAASCPGVPIDTDDWCAPDLAGWRRYQRLKPGIGVPALYYTTHIDRTGEALEESDYALLRELWAEARAKATASPT